MSNGWATDMALDAIDALGHSDRDPDVLVPDVPLHPKPPAQPYLLHWALAMGAPPDIASAVAAAATPPVSRSRDALARAVAALQHEAMSDTTGRSEWASRAALVLLCWSAA